MGAKKFREFTAAHIGHKVAIVVNNRIYSTFVIHDTLSDDVVVTGRFTNEEAQTLAMVLNSGGLPAPVTILQEKTIEPKKK